MKTNISFRKIRLVAAMAVATLTLPAFTLNAQDTNSKKVKIDITITEDGKTKRIVKEYSSNEEVDVEKLLVEMGLPDDLNKEAEEIKIIIKKGLSDDDDDYVYVKKHKDHSYKNSKKECCANRGAFLGVYMETATGIRGDEGARVTQVIENSAAEKAGLQAGDIITKINDRTISSQSDLFNAIKENKQGDKVNVEYYRNGKKDQINTELGTKKCNHHFKYYDYDFDF